MDWNNIDLNSHEIESNLVDSYTFATLLLEIECNVPNINYDTVRRQFETSLQASMLSAMQVFDANFENIVNKAIENRME